MKLEPDMIPLPSVDQSKALWHVQDVLRERLANGEQALCLCCGGDAKVYARALSPAMVKVLKAVVRADDGLSPREIVSRTLVQSDTGKLAAWGFIYKSDKDHKWRATERGREFSRGALSVAYRALIYQGNVIGFDQTRLVTVFDIAPVFQLERDVLSASAVRNADIGAHA